MQKRYAKKKRREEKMTYNIVFIGDNFLKESPAERLMKKEGTTEGGGSHGVEVKTDMLRMNECSVNIMYLNVRNMELLYCLRPMLSVEKTMYVLFINGRQNGLSAWTERWIGTLSPLIKNAPVLLVIGDINEEQNLPFDETGFVAGHKNVKKTMHMSGLDDGTLARLQENIKEVIARYPWEKSACSFVQSSFAYEYADIGQAFEMIYEAERTNIESINSGEMPRQSLYTVMQDMDMSAKSDKAEHVLSITRALRLSCPMKNGSEFIPMVCDGNEKISVARAMSDNAHHYILKYEGYSAAAAAFHRLAIELNNDLKSVWYSGAVCRDTEGHKAYIKVNGNNLHIYTDASDSCNDPNKYLSVILSILRGINYDMDFSTEEYVTYKEGDTEAEIDVATLTGNIKFGVNRIYSNELEKIIDLKKIAARYGLLDSPYET